MSTTIQIQSLIENAEKKSVLQMLSGFANAMRVSRERGCAPTELSVCLGDSAFSPSFSEQELAQLKTEYSAFFSLRIVSLEQGIGSFAAHNRMAADCDRDYLLFFSTGGIVCPRFFELILAFFEDPQMQVGAVEARQTPMEFPKDYDRETMDTSWASSACMMLPTKLFRQVQGYDEAFLDGDLGDVELSRRIRDLGYRILYRPDCAVFFGQRHFAKRDAVNGMNSNADYRFQFSYAEVFAHES